MKLSQIMAGLELLQAHYEGNETVLEAGHDHLYLDATKTPLTLEEVQRLKDMGWHQLNLPKNAPYDPRAGWSALV